MTIVVSVAVAGQSKSKRKSTQKPPFVARVALAKQLQAEVT